MHRISTFFNINKDTMSLIAFVYSFRYCFFFFLIVLHFSACSLVKPLEESPAPDEGKVKKSFFVRTETEGGKIREIPREFLCAWTPISESGRRSSYIRHGAPVTVTPCNVQFKIEEGFLIGKQIDPTQEPIDWETIFTIPIEKHYNLEVAKDQYGRPTNDLIELSTRDHWTRRKNMKLRINALTVYSEEFRLLLGQSSRTISVEDVEMTKHKDKNYWAFTLTVTSLSSQYGSSLQAKYRFNFLEYESNKNFKSVPYHMDNAKKLNALYVINKKKKGGVDRYTLRWDLNKAPIDICLFNFPKRGGLFNRRTSIYNVDYEQVAKDAIEDWNELFEETYGKRPFRVVDSPSYQNYSLDLRCSTINWIQDHRKIARMPLGTASVNADVRNGEILWTSITLYGGMLENYVKAFSVSDFSSFPSYNANADISGSSNYVSRGELSRYSPATLSAEGLLNNSATDEKSISEIAEVLLNDTGGIWWNESDDESDDESKEESAVSNEDLIIVQELLASAKKDAKAEADKIHFNSAETEDYLRILLGKDTHYRASVADFSKMFPGFIKSDWKAQGEVERIEFAYKSSHSNFLFDRERTFEDVIPDFFNSDSNLSYEDKLRNMIKELISHEFGHALGMGHNFKSNILPDENTIPKKYYDRLKSYADKYKSSESTVMGYKNAQTVTSQNYEDIKPGPHDYLVMRYLYSGEYSVWSGNEEDDFEFYKVPKSGKIPQDARAEEGGSEDLKTTYFPACDNFHQYTYHDPYCDTFVTGVNARQIVEGMFDRFSANWVKMINNFAYISTYTPWGADQILSYRSLRAFSRIRLFYEYMATKYEDEIAEVISLDPHLSNFYKTCKALVTDESSENVNNDLLDIFTKANPEFRELCYINGLAIEKMSEFLQLSGPDFTLVNHEDTVGFGSISVAGEPDASKIGGTWVRRGLLPVKYAALLTLTNPYPYGVAAYGGLAGGLFPVYRYSRTGLDYKRLYSSLYPIEYTEAIAAAVGHNISLKGIDGQRNNTIKRSVLFLGDFLSRSKLNNERHHGFDSDYLDDVTEQTRFSNNGEYVGIILSGQQENSSPDRVYKFKASMLLFETKEVIKLADAYLLPKGKVFFRQNDSRSFIHPITPIRFISNTKAYVIAIRVTFNENRNSVLWSRSAKMVLKEKYENAIENCLTGSSKDGFTNGLESYFLDKDFEGYYIPVNIAEEPIQYDYFIEKIDEDFDSYVNAEKYKGNSPKKETCEESLKNIGLITSTALSMQGIWLPEILDYVIF